MVLVVTGAGSDPDSDAVGEGVVAGAPCRRAADTPCQNGVIFGPNSDGRGTQPRGRVPLKTSPVKVNFWGTWGRPDHRTDGPEK